jgi:hypothetical protein
MAEEVISANYVSSNSGFTFQHSSKKSKTRTITNQLAIRKEEFK